MIRIARQINLNALFMAAACVGMFLLGVETSEGKPEGSLFLLPLCLAWIARDPRAMRLAVVGALLMLVLIWGVAGFDLNQASLLQWCSSAFLIVFMGGCLLEAQQTMGTAEALVRKEIAESARRGPAPAKGTARTKHRLPKDRSLSAGTLQGLLDRIEGAAFLFDDDLRLILANREAEALIALLRPNAEVAHAAEFLPEEALDLLYAESATGQKALGAPIASIAGAPHRFQLTKAGRQPLLLAEALPEQSG